MDKTQIGLPYIIINACRDDPLLVKLETKVSIKYLACLSARPFVSWESVHYDKVEVYSIFGSGEDSTVLALVKVLML
ncbi:hypothetical protein PL10110_480065 [Planktothrix agardhii]|nr:hypothetical protein PL10110_480065 [Planktothrix agardhii]